MKRKPLIAAPTPLAHAAEYLRDVEMQHKIDLVHERLTQMGGNSYEMDARITKIRNAAAATYVVGCVAILLSSVSIILLALRP